LAIKEKYAQHFAESERKKIGLQNFILPELRSANFRIAERTLVLDFLLKITRVCSCYFFV